MNCLMRRLATFLAISSTVAALATAGSAQSNVYVRFGDGRVIRSNRISSRQYVSQGAVIVNALPTGYVGDPYAYSNGNPVYYQQNYWHSHNRHWHNDPDGHYNGGHNHHHGH